MCPLHTEAKQYQNIRVWSRERFIEGHARRQVAPALKPPNSQKLSAKPYFRKGEGGMCVVVANFLVSDPLFLRSGHGSCKPPPKKKMLFSVLRRKGKVPRLNFHPVRSRSWLRGSRSQLAAPSAPGPQPPAQLSSLRKPGTQDPAGP